MTKRVLIVSLGNMGMSHALAYTRIPSLEVVGVCERRIADHKLPPALGEAKKFDSFEEALAKLKPDVVSIKAHQGSRHRHQAHQRIGAKQLRDVTGHLRRWISRLVRSLTGDR